MFIREGSSIISKEGIVAIQADKNIVVKEVTEKHESLIESHEQNRGFLSSKTTDTRDYSLIHQVKGSTISGEQITVSAGKDLTLQGSNVVGTNDVSLSAVGNVNILSAKETGKDEHYSYTKTSGLFSGGGLGFTIGSKSEKITATDQTLGEIGSTIGSIDGSVSITAGKKVHSVGTTFVTGEDLNITGKNVTIDSTINTYDSQTKYEFKQSGLTVSLGGGIVDTATSAYKNIERSGQVQDDRLKALYDYKAFKDLNDIKGELSGGLTKENLKKDVSISVSVGSTKMTSEQTTHAETVNTSNIYAGGNVSITATEGDINLKGTKIDATHVILDAEDNINIDAAENKLKTDSKTSSSSWSVGGTIGTGFFGNFSTGSGKENENATTNIGSIINARETLTILAGKDTNINGSQVHGDKVVADIGGNLNIASKQDTDEYTAKNQNSGFGVSTGPKGGVTGSIGTGKTDSTYTSVTDQAGIFAGVGGFDITVGKNTDLKGAVISSDATPDKNKLSTDTITYSNIENKADYSSSSVGANLDTHTYEKDDPNYKNQGLTPNISITANGSADSTTKSAISPGTIEVRSNPKTDISGLSRDPANALNALGKIFDKKSVEEQRELANLFGEEAFKAVGDLATNQRNKALKDAAKTQKGTEAYNEAMARADSWDEGGTNKILFHALAGGIMSDLGGNSFASGAIGAGVNEAFQKELSKIKDPGLQQLASALVGGVATQIVGGNALTGASTAVSGTKNNILSHAQENEMAKEIKDVLVNTLDPETRQEQITAIENKYTDIGIRQDILLGIEGPNGETATQVTLFSANDLNYSPEVQAKLQSQADLLERADTAYAYGYISLDERNSVAELVARKGDEYRAQDGSTNLGNIASVVIPAFLKNTPIGEVVGQAFDPSVLDDGSLGGAVIGKIATSDFAAKVEQKLLSKVTKPQYVYVLKNASDEVVYVGRTNDPKVRDYAHNNPSAKYFNDEKVMGRKGLKMYVVHNGTLTYGEARGLEQAMFEKYGGLDKLLNKINPVRPILQDLYKSKINWGRLKDVFK